MCFPCCTSKTKPKEMELVKATPLTPELIAKAKEKREAEEKIQRVVNGLREGQVFPREAGK